MKQIDSDADGRTQHAFGTAMPQMAAAQLLRRHIRPQPWPVRRFFVSIIVLLVIVCAIVWLFALLLPPRYQATASLLVAPTQQAALRSDAAFSQQVYHKRFLYAPALADSIIDQFQLQTMRAFNPSAAASGRAEDATNSGLLPTLRDTIGQRLDQALHWLQQSGQEVWSGETTAPVGDDAQAQIRRNFWRHLSLSQPASSAVLDITYQAQQPALAAAIANALAQHYIARETQAFSEQQGQANTALREQQQLLGQKRDAAEAALTEARAALAALLVAARDNLSPQQRDALGQKRDQLAADIAAYQLDADTLAAVLNAPGFLGLESVLERLADADLNALYRAGEALRGEQRVLTLETEDDSPQRQALENQIAEYDAQIGQRLGELRQQIIDQAESANRQQASIAAQLNLPVIAPQDIASAEATVTERETLLQSVTQQLDNLSNRIDQQPQLQSAASLPTVTSLSEARIDHRIVYPKLGRILFWTALAALLLGIAQAYWRAWRDPYFHSGEQLEAASGLANLALLPEIKAKRGKSETLYDAIIAAPSSQAAEAMRQMHSHVLALPDAAPPFIVAVASAAPDDGKSTVAAALARSMALGGLKVVLIDGDVRAASLHRMLACDPHPGLAELLRGDAQLADAIWLDQPSGAHVIPAGSYRSGAATQFVQDRVHHLFKALGNGYDVIVVDTPPVLAISDALTLCRLADRTIYVVSAGRSKRDTVLAGLRRLVDSGVQVAGSVLTLVDPQRYRRQGYGDGVIYSAEAAKYYGS